MGAPYHPATHGKPIDEAPKPYAFQYGVSDDYSGAKFNAQETADGKVVTGQYQVALPDGRIQTVTYTADHYNGYVADVKYEGIPVYPEANPYHPALLLNGQLHCQRPRMCQRHQNQRPAKQNQIPIRQLLCEVLKMKETVLVRP